MGFFFEQAPKPDRKSKQKRNSETLNRLGCSACPLNHAKVNSPKMPPTVAMDTWVYFLGEAPGGEEDEKGRPFVGKSGRLLRDCIPGQLLAHVSFDNVIRDRPSADNRDPTLAEVECCRGHVIRSIELAKPRVIVGVGRFALHWMLNSMDSAGLRGRFFAVKVGSHECWFMPTYHPSFVMRTAFNKDRPLNSKFGLCLKLDVQHACAKALEHKPPTIFTEQYIRSSVRTFNGEDEIFEWLAKAKAAKAKAVDIETNALRPYNSDSRILTCAFSYGSYHFSFPLDHPQSRYNTTQRLALKRAVREILKDDTTKIAHNSPFEIEWFTHYFGKEVIRHEVWECTQLQAHLLDERRGAGQSADVETRRNTYQSLDFLIKLHFGLSFKALFQINRKNIAHADLKETLLYNAADTLCTLALWHTQTAELRTRGLYNAYLGVLPRQVTVALMQYLGMPVNQSTVVRLQRKLADEIAVIEAEIEGLEVVRQYTQEHGGFNPLGEDALIVFRDYLKRKEIIKVEDGKKKYSIDKGILEKVNHPLAKLIVKLRNRTKMKSTYVDGLELGKGDLVYPDGHIHCNFNTTFTVTGRLSSDEPNMQNFPQRNDSWVREQIEAYKDHIIIAADYGQLEMCGAAMCSKDPVLVEALWNDYDTHMFWAGKLAALCPDAVGGDFADKHVAKAFRSLVKNRLVFPAIYGSTNNSIANDLKVDLSIVDELMDEFWDTFRALKRWQERLLISYREVGYVEDPTGRRRHYPLTSNEAINAPIQSLSSQIVVDGMDRLSYLAATTKQWHLHPRLNIHDDLSFIVPERLAEESLAVIIENMLTPTFGKIINVPLSVEVKTGKNWYEMNTLGKFWSHKDL